MRLICVTSIYSAAAGRSDSVYCNICNCDIMSHIYLLWILSFFQKALELATICITLFACVCMYPDRLWIFHMRIFRWLVLQFPFEGTLTLGHDADAASCFHLREPGYIQYITLRQLHHYAGDWSLSFISHWMIHSTYHWFNLEYNTTNKWRFTFCFAFEMLVFLTAIKKIQ